MPRSRPRGTPLTTTLPRGAPDCLAGLVFITTGTMETLKERELVDLVEGYGGEVRPLAALPAGYHHPGQGSSQESSLPASRLSAFPRLHEEEPLNIGKGYRVLTLA